MGNQLVVYTAIFGKRDRLRTPPKYNGVDYVCFTDDPTLKSKIWKIVLMREEGNPRRLAKIYKILPHQFFSDYSYSIWMDGTHILKCDPHMLIHDFLLEHSVAVFAHANRNCIYQEADECLSRGLDESQLIVDQMKKYETEGYPEQCGLATCSVILRRHNDPLLRNAMEDWWREIEMFSARDQLSFNYVMRKHDLAYQVIPGDVYDNHYFSFRPHINDWDYSVALWVFDRYLGLIGQQLKRFSPSLYSNFKKISSSLTSRREKNTSW